MRRRRLKGRKKRCRATGEVNRNGNGNGNGAAESKGGNKDFTVSKPTANGGGDTVTTPIHEVTKEAGNAQDEKVRITASLRFLSLVTNTA